MKILVVAATEAELSPFIARLGITPEAWCTLDGHRVQVSFTGVGPVAAAFHIQRLIGETRPDLVVQAGICGAYDGSGLQIGQIVAVVRERPADLGAVRGGRFHDIFPDNRPIAAPRLLPGDYPSVAGFTVGTAGSPFVGELRTVFSDDRAVVETMEGFSLFYVCSRLGVPFAELRTVSNRVSDEPGRWNIPLAVARLADALIDTLSKL
jgi:nucleoside phosphorylase